MSALACRCAPASRPCGRDRRSAGRCRRASRAAVALRQVRLFFDELLDAIMACLTSRRADQQTEVLQVSTDLVLKIALHLEQEAAAIDGFFTCPQTASTTTSPRST